MNTSTLETELEGGNRHVSNLVNAHIRIVKLLRLIWPDFSFNFLNRPRRIDNYHVSSDALTNDFAPFF